jgi:hypothetical protein
MQIRDCFEIKPEYGMRHASGIVVVVEMPLEAVTPSIGVDVLLRCPDGKVLRAPIEEIKDHGSANPRMKGHSFFLLGLTLQDVPDGTEMELIL